MSIRIIPKRNNAPGRVPDPAELEEGEIALNTNDGILYAKLSSGEVRQLTGDIGGVGAKSLDRLSAIEARLDAIVGDDGVVESGEWKPELIAAGGANVSQPTVTYSERQGTYTRNGSQVIVAGRLRVTTSGGSGTALAISGLPYTHSTTRQGNDVVRVWGAGTIGFSGGTSTVKPESLWGSGGNYVWLGKRNEDGGIVYYTPDDVDGVIDIVFAYTYQTPYTGGA
jgi:hypothetical protein